MRRIVFFGNCYAATLEGVFSRTLAPRLGDTASYVSCYDDSVQAQSVRRLAEADIIVAQVFDAGQKFELDVNATSAKIIPFPTVSLSSLWPYGGVAHVHNTVLPHWQCGPYDYLMGDNYLNRRLIEGVPAAVAVRDYLNLDIGKVAHLDRMHEIVVDRQRTRDEKSDMHFADEMEAHFRSEHLFFNHYRPNVRMASSLARQVYRRLDVSAADIEDLVSRWTRTPFEQTMLPIHPGVARHFGLAYGHADQRYLYHTGEMLTFEEFALRYAACEWNDDLLRGVATNHWPGADTFRAFQGVVSPEQVTAALGDVTRGLAQSRGSGIGERALAALLVRQDQPEAALAALDRAITFDPSDAESHESLARLLETRGLPTEAEAAYRAAIAQDPTRCSAHAGLSRLLAEQGRVEEAIAVLQEGIRIDSGNGFAFFDLAMLQARAGRGIEADASLRTSIAMLPTRVRPRLKLAEMLIDDGKLDAAETVLREAADLSPEDDDVPVARASIEHRLHRARDRAMPLFQKVRQQAGRLIGP